MRWPYAMFWASYRHISDPHICRAKEIAQVRCLRWATTSSRPISTRKVSTLNNEHLRSNSLSDFDNNSPTLIQNSKNTFVSYMKNFTALSSVTLTLNHDIRQQTAYNLTDFMLNYIVSNNLPKSTTVGDCLNDPAENWYRDAGGVPQNSPFSGLSNSSSHGNKKSSGSTLFVDGLTFAPIVTFVGFIIAFLI
jgi:hypothetical protein